MSSQYSVADFVALLALVRKYLYQFGGPLLIGLGSVSSILSLLVFTKKNLRKNSCSIYFIAFHTANLLYIYTSTLFITLTSGYNINPSSYNLGLCRFIIYTTFVLDILSPFYLILASIDRVLVTSPNARTRQRSTHRLAYICTISGTIFWILFQSHALVFSNIMQLAPNYFSCYFSSGVYLALVGYYSAIVKGAMVPLCMVFFGLWTLRNIRNVRRVAAAPVLSTVGVTHGASLPGVNPKNRQLIHILLMDISIYIIFSSTLSVFLMYQQITQYNAKSLVQNQIELFIRNFATFGIYVPVSISCYTNLIVSKTFRNELKNLLMCK